MVHSAIFIYWIVDLERLSIYDDSEYILCSGTHGFKPVLINGKFPHRVLTSATYEKKNQV